MRIEIKLQSKSQKEAKRKSSLFFVKGLVY